MDSKVTLTEGTSEWGGFGGHGQQLLPRRVTHELLREEHPEGRALMKPLSRQLGTGCVCGGRLLFPSACSEVRAGRALSMQGSGAEGLGRPGGLAEPAGALEADLGWPRRLGRTPPRQTFQ